MSNLRVYPRGFLGPDSEGQIERSPKPFTIELSRHQYRISGPTDKKDAIRPNPRVENVYSKYLRADYLSGNFEFRKEILTTAIAAFGTVFFDFWVLAQYKSDTTGSLHGKFLEDTILFIRTGKREMNLETWASLLQITDEGNNIGNLPDSIAEYFGMNTPGTNRIRRSIPTIEVIQDWCSKPGGLEDMLGTLHILFGRISV
jgi:hypothetical protein